MKKRPIYIIVCLILLGVFIATSLSFIIRQTSLDNVITFGNIKIKVTEKEILADESEIVIDDKNTIDITNKASVRRKVVIDNVSTHPAYIRLKIALNADDNSILDYVDIQNLSNDWIYKDGWYYYKRNLKPMTSASDFLMNINFDIDTITKNYPNSNINLKINTEAVQSENNENGVLNAVGWPSK